MFLFLLFLAPAGGSNYAEPLSWPNPHPVGLFKRFLTSANLKKVNQKMLLFKKIGGPLSISKFSPQKTLK